MPHARVLLADDHAIVAEGIASLLKDDFDLIGVVSDGAALVDAARRLVPDVIVADITMPKVSGLEAARQLAREGVASRFVILTMHDDPRLATEAFRAGAAGYLLKNSAGDELIAAIHEVLRGRVYLTPLITREVIAALSAANDDAPVPERARRLTPRQVDVLRLLARGKRMKEVADHLGLSTRTVESHKYELMQSLGISSTAELVMYAIRNQLVDASDAANEDRVP